MFYAQTTIPVLLVLLLQSPFATLLVVKYNPPVVFSFPCNDNPRYLTQEFQVPVDNTTKPTWKGVFYVDQWVSSVNVKLDIVFDNPAEIVVNPRVVHIINLDGTGSDDRRSFRLTTVQLPTAIHKIEFKVSSPKDDGLFPSVLSMSVNGLLLCDNKNRKTNVDMIQNLQNDEPATIAQTEKNRCGQRHPILAADNSEVIDWPWRISLYAKETGTNIWTMFCGGTLIGPNRVLTAGHCVKDRDLKEILVEFGNEKVTVKNLNVHKEYQQESLRDDIAVLLINEAEREESKRYPICLNADWADDSGNVTLGSVDRLKDGEFQSQSILDGVECLVTNRKDFGKYLSRKNLCTKVNSAESKLIPGDGLYEQFYDEDHSMFAWKIKGIASYTKSAPFYLFSDVSKYHSYIMDTFVGQE